MRLMDHCNVISLKHCFFSTTTRDELFLNLVMDYVPETMYKVLKHYTNSSQRMPLIYVKLYTYQVLIYLICMFPGSFCLISYPYEFCHLFQLFRGLAYMHTVAGVCHRDIKPQNILVSNSKSSTLSTTNPSAWYALLDLLDCSVDFIKWYCVLSAGWSSYAPGQDLWLWKC